MLRRDFIKTGSLTLGGLLIIQNIPWGGLGPELPTTQRAKKRSFHLYGHARSGCASPPELAPFREYGFALILPI